MVVDIKGKLKDYASLSKAILYCQNSNRFSDIEIAVIRATSHDHIPVNDKQMREILFLVSNSPGTVPFLADQISRRLTKSKDRVVALKALLLVHRLLRGGNRGFEEQLHKARKTGHLQLSVTFSKNSDTSVPFLHRYSAYLEERINWVINQAGKLEPVVKNGVERKSIDMVFRKLPKCQLFIHKVLEISPFDMKATDNLAQAAMTNILKESFQVYITYEEGVTALVDTLFDLTAPAKTLACNILKKAAYQTRQLHDLYDNCKRFVGNKNLEYPSVRIISSESIMAMVNCRRSLNPESQTELDNNSVRISQEIHARFSWTMETKISEVWVLFDDENDHRTPKNQPFFKTEM